MGTWRTRVAVAGSLLAGPRPGSCVPQQGRRGREVEGGTIMKTLGGPVLHCCHSGGDWNKISWEYELMHVSIHKI